MNKHRDWLVETINKVCQDIRPEVDVQHGPLKVAIGGAADFILANLNEVMACFNDEPSVTGTKVLKAMFDQGRHIDN